MVTIKISPDLENVPSGVYMILFSNGLFYIGSSKHLMRRIGDHIRSIKSDFSITATCKSLRKMKGFDGEVNFYLIEPVEVSRKCFAVGRPLIEKENYHIRKNMSNKMLINRGCGKTFL